MDLTNFIFLHTDKNLYFDATNLTGKTPKDLAKLVSMLASPGGFEDTLSYVILPVLAYTTDTLKKGSSPTSTSYDANVKRQRDNHGNTTGRDSAVAVLDKLAESGVRKIIRLIVEEDPNSSPHSDAAIERAVRGRDSLVNDKGRDEAIAVEIWYAQRRSSMHTDLAMMQSATMFRLTANI